MSSAAPLQTPIIHHDAQARNTRRNNKPYKIENSRVYTYDIPQVNENQWKQQLRRLFEAQKAGQIAQNLIKMTATGSAESSTTSRTDHFIRQFFMHKSLKKQYIAATQLSD